MAGKNSLLTLAGTQPLPRNQESHLNSPAKHHLGVPCGTAKEGRNGYLQSRNKEGKSEVSTQAMPPKSPGAL